MFASATSGDRYNNNKFSECSKANVSAVLDAIAEGRKPNCFTESNGAFCGNKIVEEGMYTFIRDNLLAQTTVK
jgi:disintegrin and metalloproteinase domain-containing protein 10